MPENYYSESTVAPRKAMEDWFWSLGGPDAKPGTYRKYFPDIDYYGTIVVPGESETPADKES